MKPLNSQKIQIKLRSKFLKVGVKMSGPETIFFSKDTKIGKDVSIEPYVVFGPKVKIGNNVTIKSFSHLEACKIENKVEIGPYARIRPETILKEGSKIGNFVEVKKSTIGKKTKINHLSYVGDANIGKAVNVGAGTITCNYDGIKKSKTKIKDKVFIGSNSSLVAPVTIENESVVGAGSVITKNVSKKSLALTRSLQTEIKNYKRKK
ncbi:UDP-N-acetylglucosamine pyrophosphorylase [Pelagibacterales bacterium SAG-MED22]|nr:UDP-N-acetylglucosamine pyrophosphorylase [Pelagibacterales bacterium SAG-MED22]